MRPAKRVAAGLGATAVLMGGVDAAVLNETPLERVEMVANERVEARQVGNVVETRLPWKGEEGLTVKVDMGTPSLRERMRDKRTREVITETVTDFEGGFKLDILLNERPDTNVFCYEIEGAENYDFFYQPELTLEEIAEGASRPDEIVGSYAVYHKTLKNHRLGEENYATGKVMHIPRPEVWELGNPTTTREWAELSYNEPNLCVTVRQGFLDNAEYPVRVDPTFGYTSIGASSDAGTQLASVISDTSRMYGIEVSLAESATLDSISAALCRSTTFSSGGCGGADETVDLFFAIYDKDSAATDSHDLIAGLEDTDVTVNSTPSFYTINASSESLSADTYILAAVANGEDISTIFSAIEMSYDISSSRNVYSESSTGSGSFNTRITEDPWTETAAADSIQYSLYATYTAAADSHPAQSVIWFD